MSVEGSEQLLDGTGTGELLAEQPDRLGIRHRVLEVKPQEAHKREPIPDLELGGVIRQRVEGLEHQDLEHQHGIVGRASSLEPVRPLQRREQGSAKDLEVDQLREPYQGIAVG